MMLTRITIGSLLLVCCAIHAEAHSSRLPFALNVVAKPSVLVAGQKHVFTVEIKNRSGAPLTLSSLFAFSSSVSWTNPDGSGQGTFSAGGSKLILGTNINRETGEITCKYLHYERGDFITISAHASQRFDVIVDVPKECDAPKANVTIYFESKHDGSEVGLTAWTGKAKPINLTLRVNTGASS